MLVLFRLYVYGGVLGFEKLHFCAMRSRSEPPPAALHALGPKATWSSISLISMSDAKPERTKNGGERIKETHSSLSLGGELPRVAKSKAVF